MLKVYKSGAVELSDESFAVDISKREIEDYILTEMAQDSDRNVDRNGDRYGDPDDNNDNDTQSPIGEEMVAMFRKAEERAEELVQHATDAAAVQAEQILLSARQQAAQEAEVVRARAYEDAYSQGIADGIQAKSRQVEAIIARLEEAVVRIEGELSGFIAQYEGDLKWSVLEVASKVLDKMLDRDDMEILEMVKAAVDTVKNSEWIDVHLSDEAVYLIDRLEREMSPMKYLTLVPEDLPPGSCIVDIPSGRIDASVHTQLTNLKEYFSSHSTDI